MKTIHIFWFEKKHFLRSPSKVFSFILFLFSCLYSIYNGFDVQQTQKETIQTITQEQEKEVEKTLLWFSEGKNGPEDREWVDIHEPYWAYDILQHTKSKSLLHYYHWVLVKQNNMDTTKKSIFGAPHMTMTWSKK